MKKLLMLIAFLFIGIYAKCQKVDTVINKEIYVSYYSYAYKEPLYVSYTIYKAGGECDRSAQGFRFKNDTKLITATQKDYAGSGYDEGHLADAADFSNDCIKEESTFRFYNALPQTPNLNRGIWKHWETLVRKESQTDSILVICGGIFSNDSKKIGNGVYVPDYCWKIIVNKTSNKTEHILLFTNKVSDNTVSDITIETLFNKIGFRIKL